jgi:hypothetical protein
MKVMRQMRSSTGIIQKSTIRSHIFVLSTCREKLYSLESKLIIVMEIGLISFCCCIMDFVSQVIDMIVIPFELEWTSV